MSGMLKVKGSPCCAGIGNVSLIRLLLNDSIR